MIGMYMMRNLTRLLVRDRMWDESFYLLTNVRWTLRQREEGGLADLRDTFHQIVDAMKDYDRRRGKHGTKDT